MLYKNTSNRFGNMPLPIENASGASDGELMVGRTTGHIYVRNGGKNMSKTVELEEFLKQFRVGCSNLLRNSGDFDEYAIDHTVAGVNVTGDWYFCQDGGLASSASNAFTIKEIPETPNKVMEVTFTGGEWGFISNRLPNYMDVSKLKFRKGEIITGSIKMKVSKDTDIVMGLSSSSGTNVVASPVTKSIKVVDGWVKLEFPMIATGNVFEIKDIWSGTCLSIQILNRDNNVITFGDVQLERADRSSGWNKSWRDNLQRLNNINSNLKDELTKYINKKFEEANNYTDTSITDLTADVKSWITTATNTSKKYTDDSITNLHNTINGDLTDIDKKIEDHTTSLIFGQFDWRKYIGDPTGLEWDATNKYVYGTMDKWYNTKTLIPIAESCKYYIEFDIENMSPDTDSPTYAGVICYDENGAELITDNQNTYNYGNMGGGTIPANGKLKSGVIYEGYNPLASDKDQSTSRSSKFDPRASYFSPMFISYYTVDNIVNGKLAIKSIKVYTIPECLWDALSEVTLSKDGLMTPDLLAKLNGIEVNANKYIHPTNDGNLHVPATGTSNNGKWLKAGSTPGSFAWTDLPTDGNSIGGMTKDDFVWRRNIKQDTGRVCRFNRPDVLNKNPTGDINNSMVKLTFNTNTSSDSKFMANFIVYGTSKVSEVSVTFTTDGSNLINMSAFISNNDLVKNIYITKNSSSYSINIETGGDVSPRVIIDVQTFIVYNIGPDMDIVLSSTVLEWVLKSSVSKTFKITNINNNLNADTLDGRDSRDFANMFGANTTSYTATVNDKQAAANILTRGNDEDSWVILDNSGGANYGMYYRNINSDLVVSGSQTLPKNTYALVGGSDVKHYFNLDNGDVFHKGKLTSANIDTGRFKIKYNESDMSLDFIFE